MDDFMLELELIHRLDEAEKKKVEEEKKVTVSPYKNATQEGMGQLSNLFFEVDEVLMAVFDEEFDNERQDG